ncbi:NAD-dependent epimerase/dehydratase family protein [Bradyrhizobium frederickii]|uniref:NAD-dependent epimerase/dehydratase family protein n=1 Tax=Bradyrhizobium frederickii TaxID=2560054 RepID=A0A4Y9KWE8_9BRAD|nr:NAD-dependent epimerase/dehydratase family protein [Bradyrhizobium frederickii]TFV34787.1 NAD-dependent epimerase/dehydratase family protein [Bradyrhizobium frederickii]
MSETKPVALVTGASGFVGRHVVRALTREGWSVRRAVRSSQRADDEVVIDSIGPETDWQAALEGVDAVIHLAARVHSKNDEHADEHRKVNVEGTLRLARHAATAGVRHFIFISTVLVHGRSNDGRAPFSESDLPTPRGLYGTSKAAAEAGLSTLARDVDMKISVIRPPLIYGAHAKGNFTLLARAVRLGLPLPFAAIRNRCNFLAVQNLSSFILHRLGHPDAVSNFEIFLLADRERVSTPEFIACLGRASGRTARLFSIPPNLLGMVLRVMGRQDMQDGLIGSLELDISKAIATGWQPQVSLDEGVRLALSDQDA